MIKLAHHASNALEKANKVNEAIAPIREKAEKAFPEEQPEGMKELEKLDVSKKPIQELVDGARQAVKVWDDVLDTLVKEKYNRLRDPKTPSKEPMLALAKRLLPRIQIFTDEELDQIELLYLWQMIGSYVKNNVSVVEHVDQYGRGKRVEILGLNNTQQDTICNLFGFQAKRGRYFYTAPVWNIFMVLYMWGVKPVTQTYMKMSSGWANS